MTLPKVKVRGLSTEKQNWIFKEATGLPYSLAKSIGELIIVFKPKKRRR